MKAYRITDWDRLYEVDERNRAWAAGAKKRPGPLKYVRCRVNGGNWSSSFRAFRGISGETRRSPATCFGVFIKCLELAAGQIADRRGWLLDRRGEPLDAEGIAGEIGFPVRDVTAALVVLCDPRLAWIAEAELPESLHQPRIPPEKPGEARVSPLSETDKETETETETEGDAPAKAGSCPFEEIAAAWNKAAEGTPLRQVLNPANLSGQRKAKLTARWREPVFRLRYPEVFEKVAATPFLSGKNDRKWRATFDWLIVNDTNYGKVLEGQYENGEGEEPPDTGSQAAKQLEGLEF